MRLKYCVMASVLLMSQGALATNQGPGCGVGTNIFKGQTGLGPHSTAYTINGTFSQPSAITTGTSGCTSESMVMNDGERRLFVSANYDELAKQSARGQGDLLVSLAAMSGVNNNVDFQKLMQAHYQDLFANTSQNSIALLSRMDAILATAAL